MKNLFVLLLVIIAISVSKAEVDTSYECLKNAIAKMTNSSCPLITPEVERNIDDYARLYTACTKGHYLIHGCNESEWVHACTRRVANIPNTASSDSLTAPMWEQCNKDVVDPDYECFGEAITAMNKESCPNVTHAAREKFGLKAYGGFVLSCYKMLYIKHGCNEDQWVRVCNRQMDRNNVAANGGQDATDMFRSHCTENPAYACFEKAIENMNGESCPEVIYSKSQNETIEESMRHQTSCYKRFYLNAECDIAQWKKVCSLFSFTFKPKDEDKSKLMRKYCSN